MEISQPNENGVLNAGLTEIVAKRGRSYAVVKIALCEDGNYRYALDLQYSYGGFSGPIGDDSEPFATLQAAKTAGMEQLRRRWPKPFPCEPQSVHDELQALREQIESQLRQPSLF